MMISETSGCKVGWKTFTTEAEAQAESEHQAQERERKFALGFDFGYQWPGAISRSDHDEHGHVWTVVTV